MPVITGDSEITYPVDSTVSETQFIKDAHIVANDEKGSVEAKVDLSTVDFSTVGDYEAVVTAANDAGVATMSVTVHIIKKPGVLAGTKVTTTLENYISQKQSNSLDSFLKEQAALTYDGTPITLPNNNLTITNFDELQEINTAGDYTINFSYKTEDNFTVTTTVDLSINDAETKEARINKKRNNRK